VLASSRRVRGRIARFDRKYNYQNADPRTSQIVSSSTDRSPVIILTTLAATTDAAALARVLVSDRLAACVNVLPPMTSLYRWKGAVEEEIERQLVIKTTSDRVAAIEARFREVHPYELPEFVVLSAGASASYLEWLRDSVAAT
jgi:periplasmic divalent cation tolerance protein